MSDDLDAVLTLCDAVAAPPAGWRRAAPAPEPDWPEQVPVLTAADVCRPDAPQKGGARTLWDWLVSSFPGVGTGSYYTTEDPWVIAGWSFHEALMKGARRLSGASQCDTIRQVSELLSAAEVAALWNRTLAEFGYVQSEE